MQYLIHYFGLSLCVIGLALLGFVKGKNHWSKTNITIGLLLVFCAAISVYFFNNVIIIYDIMAKYNVIDDNILYEAKESKEIWIYVFPAVIGSIGANLIAAWFMSSKK